MPGQGRLRRRRRVLRRTGARPCAGGVDPRRQPRAVLRAPRRRRAGAARARRRDPRRGARLPRQRDRTRSRATSPATRSTRPERDARRAPGSTPAAVNDVERRGPRAWATAIEAREGTVRVGRGPPRSTRRCCSAAERLAHVNGKLVTAGDEYAKRTARIATGRLDVLRRLAAPGDDDVVWVERVGRTRRLRIAPVAAGETIAHASARVAAGHRRCRRRSAASRRSPRWRARWVSTSTPRPGSWGERDDERPLGVERGPGLRRRCRRRRRSTGRRRGCCTSPRTCPTRPGRATRGCEAVGRPAVRARQRGRRAGARVVHVARERRSDSPRCCASAPTIDVLAQGDRDSGRLTQEFLEDETSVLVGTRSFWAGIDAAGRGVRARRDRQDPVPRARRAAARGAASARAAARRRRVRARRPARRRARARAGRGSPHPHA